MKYSNELKVGVSIVAAIILFVFGVRYLQDMPMFSGSYELVTEFDEVNGLVSGNPVRISGVNVGDVSRVVLEQGGREVRVHLRISRDIAVPEGSVVKQSGWSQFGGVQLVIEPGPASNPPLQSGDYIPSEQTPGVLGNITEQAGPILNRVDTLLRQLDLTAEQVERELGRPESDLRRTLTNLEALTGSLQRILAAEEGNVEGILTNTRAITEDTRAITQDIRNFTENNRGELQKSLDQLNTATGRLDSTLNTYNQLGTQLQNVAAGVEQGDGTLGHLAEDPRLYNRIDSLVVNLNELVIDLRQNPRRYLRHIRGIDLF